MPNKEKKKCKYCYGKGSYSVAEGGNIAMGDFEGDPSYIVPFKINQHPCKRCNKPLEKRIKEVFPDSKHENNWEHQIELLGTAWLALALTQISVGHNITHKPIKDFVQDLLDKQKKSILSRVRSEYSKHRYMETEGFMALVEAKLK